MLGSVMESCLIIMKIFGRFNFKTIAIICILLLAGFLRLWELGKIPVGFTPDEASFGYDAYSLIHTGRDQWGKFLPVTLESFGDFKSPLYAYLAIPAVAVFGLTEFAVRLPNAIVGVGAVYVLYLLLGEIGKLSKLEQKKIDLLQVSGALFLTISSWHVMMSRGAFEANLITLFIPLGIYFFLKSFKSTLYSVLCTTVFGLSLFTYHSAKLLAPIILILLVIIFWKIVIKNWKQFLIPFAVFIVFFSILIYSFKIGGGSRIVERSITQGAQEEGAKIKIQLIQEGVNPVLAKLTHNKFQVTVQRFLSNYSQYFSINFLFVKGPAETTYGMLPGVGVLYVFEGLLLIGLIPLSYSRKETRMPIVLLTLWLLLAPLPAALATGVGYAANRAEGMIPVWQMLIAFGFVGWNTILEKLNKNVLVGTSVIVAILVSSNLSIVLNKYFFKSPFIVAPGMLFGRGEAIRYSFDNKEIYDTIIVSRTLSEPQIYTAFYTKYDPVLFQRESQNWEKYRSQNLSFLDQLGEYKLGKFTFKNIDSKTDLKVDKTLFLGKPSDFPEGIAPIRVVSYPDGSSDIYIVKI